MQSGQTRTAVVERRSLILKYMRIWIVVFVALGFVVPALSRAATLGTGWKYRRSRQFISNLSTRQEFGMGPILYQQCPPAGWPGFACNDRRGNHITHAVAAGI